MQVRAATGGGQGFHGLASRTDTPYEMWDMFGPYTEIVSAGAFGSTLAQANLDVPLVLDHVRSQVFASTMSQAHPLTLVETADGLEADAPTPDWSGFEWLPGKINSGLITEMSFRFSITRGQWSPDWMEYHIEEVDINRGDVAIVGYGANPYTQAELRSLPEQQPELAARTDVFVLNEYRRVRAELRTRGLKPPMALEDL
jgi:HK97 family phage prohead protease